MARLPIPGSDDGTWGDILNQFLAAAHNDDGSLKNAAVTTGAVQDSAITEAKLDSDVQNKLNAVGSGGVVSVNGETGVVTLSKGDIGLGNVDNTSDLNKPISTATQTALDAKATTASLTSHTSNTSNPHSVTKAQVGLSNVDNTSDANKPVSTAVQAALDAKSGTSHTHATYVALAGTNLTTLSSSAVQFLRVNVPDDGSPTSGWPDRHVYFFDGTRTGYFNEYGELRARPAKTSTVALRAMGHASGGSSDILQVTNSGQSATYFSVSSSAAAFTVPVSSTGNITAPNIGAKVLVLDAGDPVPGGTPTGTVILRRA